MSARLRRDEPNVSLTDGMVVYGYPENPLWSLSVENIAVIGEYTNNNGPYFDDYYIVLVDGAGETYLVSFYADSRESFLSQLGQELDAKLECRLCNSVDYISRVMWPLSICDRPLFDFVPVVPQTLVQRIKGIIAPSVDLILTATVQECLESEQNAV